VPSSRRKGTWRIFARSLRPKELAVLLHGDLHGGKVLVASNNELVAIDPTPALGEQEQDIGDAATGEEPPGGVDPDELLKYATRELG